VPKSLPKQLHRKKNEDQQQDRLDPARPLLKKCGWFLLLSSSAFCICAAIGKLFDAPPMLTTSVCLLITSSLAIALLGDKCAGALPKITRSLRSFSRS
jgi:hypothetical protein